MIYINLANFYSWYTEDEYIEVTDAVAEALLAEQRYEKSHRQRIRRNSAFYSLDAQLNLEASAINHITYDPEEIFIKMQEHCRLCQALNSLPEMQGKRVEAHYLLGKSQKEIAGAEGVTKGAVNHSIKIGLKAMKRFLETYPSHSHICSRKDAHDWGAHKP